MIPSVWAPCIDEIAATGASHVALVVTWAQTDVRSIRLQPGVETVADAALSYAIGRARERDLKVIVFPIVTVRTLAPGEWRGTLRPADVDAWWRSYERFILHYAKLAAASKAEALLVGSELGTTEAWQYRWYHLISAVERVYQGMLVYSANWDHYQQVSFWRRLDVIGVTGYFELTRSDDASVAELQAAWIKARDQLLEVARRHGKPLWITEVGYTSVNGTARQPWDVHWTEPRITRSSAAGTPRSSGHGTGSRSLAGYSSGTGTARAARAIEATRPRASRPATSYAGGSTRLRPKESRRNK